MKTNYFVTVFIFNIILFLVLNLPLFIIQFVQFMKKRKNSKVIVKNVFTFLILPFSGLLSSLIVSSMGMYSTDDESIAFLEGALLFVYIIWAVLNILFCSFLNKLVYEKNMIIVMCSILVGEVLVCIIPFIGVIGYICSIVVLPSCFFYYLLLKKAIMGENIKKCIAFLVLIYPLGALLVQFINGDSIDQKIFLIIAALIIICMSALGIIIFFGIEKVLKYKLKGILHD